MLSTTQLDREKEQTIAKVREMLVALERGATRVILAAQQAANDANDDKYKA